MQNNKPTNKDPWHFYHIGIFVLLFFFVFLGYRYILQSFFQQDEWVSLGTVLGGGLFAELKKFSLVYLLAGYVRVFGTLCNNILHSMFPLNPLAFAVFGIFFHTINAFLVYLIYFQLTQRRNVAVLAGIFFATVHAHHQALTWFASTTTTLPSLTFGLLALYFAIIKGKSISKYSILLSQLFLVISFLFKESSIILIPFLPLLSFYFSNEKEKKWARVLLRFLPLLLYLFYVLSVRFFLFYTEDKRGAFVTKENNSRSIFLKNIVLYPLIGISQEYIPSMFIYPISNKFMNTTQLRILDSFGITELKKLVFIRDFISLFISIAILVFVFYMWLNAKNRRFILILSLLLLMATFIPLSVLQRGESYFDSRYFYFASIGGAFLFASVIYEILIFCLDHNRSLMKIGVVGIILIVSGYLYKNISLTRALILQNNVEGIERKNILTSLKEYFPTLSSKSIMYVTGDSLGYYGVAEQKVPFQQGFGYSLMVYYYKTGHIPKELLVDWYKLWDMRFQGYWDYGKESYGYFWSFDSLQQLIKEDKSIQPEQIHAVFYESSNKKLIDITEQTKKKLFNVPIH